MTQRHSSGPGRSFKLAALVPTWTSGPSERPYSWWPQLRDFIAEIAIIVIGVLIALGADNIVSTMRDKAASAEARATIRDELAENLGRMVERDATRDCIDKRLDEIARHLDASDAGATEPAFQWIGRPQVWPMLDSRWQATASAGKASLLSSKEQGDFGAIYANIRDFQDNQQTEQLAWAQLRAMAGRQRVSPQESAMLRAALQNARYAAWQSHIIVWQVTQDAARLGIRPMTEMKGSRSICIPTSTPFEQAVRQAGASRFGEPR